MLKEAFVEADADDSGSITIEEFEQHLKDPKVRAHLASVGFWGFWGSDICRASGGAWVPRVFRRGRRSVDDARRRTSVNGPCPLLRSIARINILRFEYAKILIF